MPHTRKKSTLNIDSRLKNSARNAERSNAKSNSSRSSAHKSSSVHNGTSVHNSVRKMNDSLANNDVSTVKAVSPKKQQKAEKKRERNALKQRQKQAKEDKKRAKNEAKLEKLKATKEKKSVQKKSRNNVYVMPASDSVPKYESKNGLKNEQLEYKNKQSKTSKSQTDQISEDTQDLLSQTNPATLKAALEEDMQRSKRRAKSRRRIRAEQRAKRQHNAYVVYVLRVLIIVAVAVGLIFGAIFVYRSDMFHIDNVEVSGIYHLNNLEVTRIAAISDDSTLLRLDEKGIKQRLCENAWVQDVELKREFPNTLKIIITERSAAAAVRINDKSIWVVSADGAWLSSATNDDWNNNPRIVDVSTSIASPVSGKACDDEGILNALTAVKVLSQRTKDELDTISAESAAKMTLNLKSGVSVAFGEAKDVELKEAAIWSILDKLQGKVSYINVHVPSRPTYRSIVSVN